MAWNRWLRKFERPATNEEKLAFKERAATHVELLNRLRAFLSPMFPSPQRNRYGEGGSYANEIGKIHDTIRLVGIITGLHVSDLNLNKWPNGTELPAELVLPKVKPKKISYSRNEVQWEVILKKDIMSPKALLEALEKKIYPEEIMHWLQGTQPAEIEIKK